MYLHIGALLHDVAHDVRYVNGLALMTAARRKPPLAMVSADSITSFEME